LKNETFRRQDDRRYLSDLSEETTVDVSRIHEFFRWPPDAFAFTSVVLGESGAYRSVVDPPKKKSWPNKQNKNWTQEVEKAGELWKEWFIGANLPAAIKTRIDIVRKYFKSPVARLSKTLQPWELCTAILELHAFADEACEGIGIPGGVDLAKYLPFNNEAYFNLQFKGTLARIHTSRVRVLPKLRTPQVGISLRSLSHHLSIDRSEVNIEWFRQPVPALPSDLRTLNLVILPWPLNVDARSFKKAKWSLDNLDSEEFGFFSYEPYKIASFTQYLKRVLKKAQTKVGDIHGVVLPESALNADEVQKFKTVLGKLGIAFFVTGVRKPKENFAQLGLLYAGKYGEHIQHKHHRWLIDETQIHAYHLGSALHPSKKYWEAIEVRQRAVNFICVNEWLTMCHLICEDLARHDPVTHLVRSVGPNLVIALLLDGPQLGKRWPGRYASVLADDPGSSVLTVTSLGMAIRSRPNDMPEARVIALWKDSKSGPREISLENGKEAAVLTLCANYRTEWTADGRSDGKTASELVLSGVETI
jgi:hypothetical protein